MKLMGGGYMFKRNLLYSTGSFAAAITSATFSTYIMFFYVDVLKLPSELIGIGMAIYGIWNAINDPILGQLSDRTRSKWGRRIPYILFGSIPFVLAFIFVWLPPVGLFHNSIIKLFAYFMGIIFIYDGLYTLVIINWTSLYPEMYKTQKERTSVSAMRQIIGILGNILGIAIPPILYSSIGWGPMGILFGVLTLITLGLSLLGAKEDPTYSEGETPGLIKSIAYTFSNKSFLIYVVGAMFVQLTFVLLQAGIPFYAKYVLKVSGFNVSILLGSTFIVALLFMGMWSDIANKKGSKFTMIIASLLYAAALIPLWFSNTFIAAVISTSFLGIGLSGILLLLDVFISDIADEDELKTGARREGMYFGINGFMIRLGISVQSLITGYVLKITGYNANLGVGNQPINALIGIKSIITIIPLISIIIALLLFTTYPLYGDKLNEVKKQVALRHTSKNISNN